MNPDARDARPLFAAGMLLGIGMGGFVDGIVFHQVLQLHGMLTARYPKTGVPAATALVNSEINMFWDGLFHMFCWLATGAGVVLLWRATRDPKAYLHARLLGGAALFGWGVFNLVEGAVDHLWLGLHHVVEAGRHLPWDLAFLASGVVLMLAGWQVASAPRRVEDPSPS